MRRRRHKLAARRRALGHSQESLAEILDVAVSTVARLEQGGGCPLPALRRRLADALAVSLDDLALLLSGDDASLEMGTTPPDRRGWRVEREEPSEDPRDVGRQVELFAKTLTDTFLPVLSLDELGHIVAAVDNARRFLDAEVIGLFRRQLAACAAEDGSRGPRRTLPSVLGIVGAVEYSARHVKATVRRDLLSVGAHGAEFLGWLYRDVRKPKLAAYWYDRAIEWAQEAGDLPMQGYILLKKAQAAWDERDALRMLTLAQAVQDGPWRLPVKVRAEAAQQEARGHAMLGENLGSIERKLEEAQRLLAEDNPQAGDTNTTDLGTHYNRSLLTMQVAICYTEAGQPQRAVRVYQGGLSDASFSRRDYSYFLSLMGSSLAQADEPDAAATVGLEALPVAVETSSMRTMQELVRLTDLLNPWKERPSVRGLREAMLT